MSANPSVNKSEPSPYFQPDVVTYRDTIGWCPWWVAFPVAMALAVAGLWLADLTITHLTINPIQIDISLIANGGTAQ